MKGKKLLALIIVVALVLTTLPAIVFAENSNSAGGSTVISDGGNQATIASPSMDSTPSTDASASASQTDATASESQSADASASATQSADATASTTQSADASPSAPDGLIGFFMKLFALTPPTQYTVTFKAGAHGSFKNPSDPLIVQTVPVNGTATAPEITADPGYSFNNQWSRAFDKVTANITVTAQYTINSYKVTFDSNGGSAVADITKNYNQKCTLPTPTLTGYTFEGWFTDNNTFANQADTSYTVTADVMLYAKWTITHFTVTFNDWDNSNISSDTVNYGGAATPPTPPDSRAADGLKFNSWNKDFSYVTSDLTVKATYAANPIKLCTVQFVPNGGSAVANISKNSGGVISGLPSTHRTGFTFEGWYDKNGAKAGIAGDSFTVPEDTVLYARWDKYPVTFLDYNGAVLLQTNVAYGDAAIPPANPLRTGYRFTNWDKSFSNITSDLTVTAQYVQQFTVRYLDWDNTVLTTQTVDYNGTATAPTTNPDSKPNYHFTGWDKSNTNITANTDITAVYAIDTFTVRYLDWDNTVLTTQSVDYNGTATAPTTNPDSKPNYHFSTWDKSNTNITANTDITAVYTIDTFTVRYLDWDNTVLTTQTVDYNGTATAPTTTPDSKPNYHFSIWDKSNTNITANTDITAVYAIDTFTVRYLDWDNTVLTTQTVDYNGTATAPTTTPDSKPNYHFSAWDKANTNITANTDITAVYAINTFTVRYLDWDGAVLTTQTVDYNGTATAPTTTPDSKPNYHFSAWDKANTNITANTDITAVYAINTFTVRYLDWDGAVLTSQSVDYNGTATAPTTTPDSKPNYHFSAWDKANTNITANTDITAVYAINTFTVRYLDWDGAVLTTQTVDYNGTATAPTTTPDSKPNYHFSVWDKSNTNITANTDITAVYAINQYTIIFKNYDGTILNTQTVDWGKSATAPANPAAPSAMHFTGWDKDFSNVTSDLTVTALFAVNTYSVEFLNYDGTLLKVQWVDENNAATAPANPTRPGYRFTGWSAGFDKVTNNLTVTALFTPATVGAAAPAAQPTVLPSASVPAAAPSVSASAPAPASPQTTVIPSQSAPAAAPSASNQTLDQNGGGVPAWVWILIAAVVAAFLIWFFGFWRRGKNRA